MEHTKTSDTKAEMYSTEEYVRMLENAIQGDNRELITQTVKKHPEAVTAIVDDGRVDLLADERFMRWSSNKDGDYETNLSAALNNLASNTKPSVALGDLFYEKGTGANPIGVLYYNLPTEEVNSSLLKVLSRIELSAKDADRSVDFIINHIEDLCHHLPHEEIRKVFSDLDASDSNAEYLKSKLLKKFDEVASEIPTKLYDVEVEKALDKPKQLH